MGLREPEKPCSLPRQPIEKVFTACFILCRLPRKQERTDTSGAKGAAVSRGLATAARALSTAEG
jgi:hypothetical protein